MTARVVFASCADLPEGSGDEAAVAPALAAVGVGLRWVRWDHPGMDFAAADLVVLRATWDYSTRHTEFLDWCDSVPALRNQAPVVRWNTDKSYLMDLAGAGLGVVATEVVPVGRSPRWPEGDVVVKPAVGAGSRGAGRFSPERRDAAAEHLAALHAAGRTALVQPYQTDVDTGGETALVFLGGGYSHAFGKAAMLPGEGVLSEDVPHPQTLRSTDPEPAYRALAEDVLDATAARFGLHRSELLYARVDVVTADDGTPSLLELELVEPLLGFAYADAAAPSRFASAIRAHLD